MSIHQSLQDFCEAVKTSSGPTVQGAPEDQLRTPFKNLMVKSIKTLGGRKITCTGEPHLGHIGRPDYAVQLDQLISGYVELKAPGTGANAGHFRGHNREQFKRFSVIPNLLYTDGNEWALYRDGKLVGQIVQISGDILTDGKNAVTAQDAQRVENLLHNFLQWQPIIPTNKQGKIHLRKFAEMLAPLCRMLRRNVTDALKDPSSPLVQLAGDWRQLLFPNASDEQFADAYAQTVTFALLLGRSEGADPLTLSAAVKKLDAQHSLLSRALRVLTDPKARKAIEAPLDLLVRVIAAVPPAIFTNRQSPWLYFYEDFLAAYDPDLRKDTGAYYTPVQVVHAQVRLIDELLTQRLGKPWGFADPDVVTLDPAAGTGTYLLGVIEHALQRVENRQGPGAVPGKATDLARNLYGFELLVGPFAVAELRVSRALLDQGAKLPVDGTHIYLTDTLENPNATPLQLPFYLQPIAEQHEKALKVKGEVPVIVCLGNPPYDRHAAATPDNKAETGGWVRWGEYNGGDDEQDRDTILDDFIEPAIAAGHGLHVKNLYNLYVYFWRWALWKVFEHETSRGQGIVSFITASSYLEGDAFSGMREHMRRLCDEVWIIDLGGEGRGTRREDNVFAIQTPVAIAIALRDDKEDPDKPARVHYTRIEGSEREKLNALEVVTDFKSLEWRECPDDWLAPFLPAGKGRYFDWPLITDLMPWQRSGVMGGRTWVIGPDKEVLERRWRILLNADKEDRGELFKNSPSGRKVHKSANQLLASQRVPPIQGLPSDTETPKIVPYAYRSFDRQFILADGRLIDRPGRPLWRTYSKRQVYLTTLLNHPLGQGPAFTACAAIPDRHHFRGSYGAKEIIPLYRATDASEANIASGLLDLLGQTYEQPVTPEDFVAYVYGLLAQPAFTERFFEELKTKELRVPITRDVELFENVRQIGAKLLWLHTYGRRFLPPGKIPGRVPQGKAKCTKAVPGDRDGYPESYDYNDTTRTLRVGKGEFKPVAPEVFDFEVSGLKVVQSWLDYRMKGGAGRKSSPLDDINPETWPSQFTTELLELLWVLEKTVAGYPEQKRLLEAVVAEECFAADELPSPPERMRKPSKDKGKYAERLI